jgi:hypothetical protein
MLSEKIFSIGSVRRKSYVRRVFLLRRIITQSKFVDKENEMIPGPDLIYNCPKCGRKAVRKSIRSGNTIGSVLYSDGKQIAHMLPTFPYFIKCGKCKRFYRLEEKNKIGKDYGYMHDRSKMKNTDCARFLSIDEYIEAIKLKVYANKDEEIYLRRRLWWAFNDKYRGHSCELDYINRSESRDMDKGKDKDSYESNCIGLIEILDKDEIDDKITCAELYRNLGKYTECKNILETIHEEKYNWIKEVLTKECEKDNRKVIKLSK